MYLNLKIVTLFILGTTCALGQAQSPKHELRGAWIATVANIDWPSKPGLSSEEQQKEFRNIVAMHKSNGMNALFVQVRPAADAFYPSRLEPWSSWLTGKLGKYPEPYYDPLQFMIDETHGSGMEFHAWLNPYRAVVNVDTAHMDSASVAFQHPSWFVKYDKNLYFDPGLPEARMHVVNVVVDIIRRYDVDGIHFDDYFYPYKVTGINFPDSTSFAKYGKQFTSIDDWRRDNVNQLIKTLHDSIESIKPFVQFGVSPFGVWRNQDKDSNGSATRAGQTCYDDLYADVLKWMQEKWIDYVAPQIYWSIGFEVADYDIIARWWNKNNFELPVYVGQAMYRVNSTHRDTHWKEADQIPKQIRLNRGLQNVKGSIYFSSKSFSPNPLGVNDSLRANYYRAPSLPAFRGKNRAEEIPVSFLMHGDSVSISWPAVEKSSHDVSKFVLYRFKEKQKIDFNNAEAILQIVPVTGSRQQSNDVSTRKRKKYIYAVTSVDRFGNESEPASTYSIKRYGKYWKSWVDKFPSNYNP